MARAVTHDSKGAGRHDILPRSQLQPGSGDVDGSAVAVCQTAPAAFCTQRHSQSWHTSLGREEWGLVPKHLFIW